MDIDVVPFRSLKFKSRIALGNPSLIFSLLSVLADLNLKLVIGLMEVYSSIDQCSPPFRTYHGIKSPPHSLKSINLVRNTQGFGAHHWHEFPVW